MKFLKKKEKIFFNILFILFGFISVILVVAAAMGSPILTRYKWYKRQRKIKKAILKKLLKERENEPLIRIY
jgi:hypothetical protein